MSDDLKAMLAALGAAVALGGTLVLKLESDELQKAGAELEGDVQVYVGLDDKGQKVPVWRQPDGGAVKLDEWPCAWRTKDTTDCRMLTDKGETEAPLGVTLRPGYWAGDCQRKACAVIWGEADEAP